MAAAIPWVRAPWLANATALLGGFLYLVQSWQYAHTLASLLDEGAYLLKGLLFVTGRYWPFQDYGPWTNHMPLAFYIPGVIQALFGPGLRPGRYFAVALGVLLILGVWLLVRRIGGRWWAALAVWTLALNPALIKLYSLAVSEVLLACMLVWILNLTLGDARPTWKILLGSILAGMMLMTRFNLAPVPILLVVYLFWMHGWQIGWKAALAAAAPVIAAHVLFWPNILRHWAYWLPGELFPFLKPYARPPGSEPTWDPSVTPEAKVMSFLYGIRFHFTALAAALATWLAWPRKDRWETPGQFKTAVFLSILLLVLVLSHLWASLGKNYCTFCFPVYLSFFSLLGPTLLVVTFSSWERNLPAWRGVLIGLAILSLGIAIGYSAFTDIGNQILQIQVPRVRTLQILPGSVTLGAVLQNKFGGDPQSFQRAAIRILPSVAGLIVGTILLLVAVFLTRHRIKREGTPSISSGFIALTLVIISGLILSPTVLLGGGFHNYDCGGDVIRSYELAGEYLAQRIPPGSLVYWDAGGSTVPLLYVEKVKLFPAQINGIYSLRRGGDPNDLERYGFWSEELAHRWASEAEFILLGDKHYKGWLAELIESGGYREFEPTLPTMPCDNRSVIHIYMKKP